MNIPFSKIYAGTKLIWKKVVEFVFGCFGSGRWIKNNNWSNLEIWKNDRD